MLISHKFLNHWLRANTWHPKLCGSLFDYNPSTQRVRIKQNKRARTGYLARGVILNITVGTILFRVYKLLQRSGNASAKLEANACMLPFATCLICAERYRARGSNPEEAVDFLNSALQLEQRYGDEQGTRQSRKMQLASLMCRFTDFACDWVFPKGLSIICGINVELPLNLAWTATSWINKEWISGYVSTAIYRVFVGAANYVLYHVLAAQGTGLVTDILVGSLSLQHYLGMMRRRLERTLCANETAQANLDNLYQEAEGFRAFQIVTNRYNASMRTLLFGCLLCTGIVQIESLVMLLRQTSSETEKLPWPISIFFFALVLQTSLIIVVCFGFAGDFYRESVYAMTRPDKLVKRRMQRCGDRYMERFIASCQPTRIYVGLSNFIDKLTPLVFQLFCLQRVIDILLLKK